MEIKIIEMSPVDIDITRLYFTIDSGNLQSVLMNHSDLANINSVEKAIEDLLMGKQYIGHTFTIES
ncbi:MAG: hypothetical protein ACTSPB_07555 [Candidatus Thorarchaeota archaeon]